MLLTGHEGEVFGTKFSPDGKLLASGGFDRLICEYESMVEKYLVCHFQLGGLEDGYVGSIFYAPAMIIAGALNNTPVRPFVRHTYNVRSISQIVLIRIL